MRLLKLKQVKLQNMDRTLIFSVTELLKQFNNESYHFKKDLMVIDLLKTNVNIGIFQVFFDILIFDIRN